MVKLPRFELLHTKTTRIPPSAVHTFNCVIRKSS